MIVLNFKFKELYFSYGRTKITTVKKLNNEVEGFSLIKQRYDYSRTRNSNSYNYFYASTYDLMTDSRYDKNYGRTHYYKYDDETKIWDKVEEPITEEQDIYDIQDYRYVPFNKDDSVNDKGEKEPFIMPYDGWYKSREYVEDITFRFKFIQTTKGVLHHMSCSKDKNGCSYLYYNKFPRDFYDEESTSYTLTNLDVDIKPSPPTIPEISYEARGNYIYSDIFNNKEIRNVFSNNDSSTTKKLGMFCKIRSCDLSKGILTNEKFLEANFKYNPDRDSTSFSGISNMIRFFIGDELEETEFLEF